MIKLNAANVLIHSISCLFSKIFFIPLAFCLLLEYLISDSFSTVFIYSCYIATTISLIMLKEKIYSVEELVVFMQKRLVFLKMTATLMVYALIIDLLITTMPLSNIKDTNIFSYILLTTFLFFFLGVIGGLFTRYVDETYKTHKLINLNSDYIVNMLFVSIITSLLFLFLPFTIVCYLIVFSSYFLYHEYPYVKK